MITIIDYGMGNLRSVQKSFEKAGAKTQITQSVKEIENAEVLVLPGVGAFGAAMQNLQKMGFVEPIKKHIQSGRPFLGICLGMQVLFPYSEENPDIEGLGIFEGSVRRFQTTLRQAQGDNSPLSNPHSEFRIPKLRVPHMGWNQLNPKKESDLLAEIAPDSYTYFVHSYYVDPEDKDIILTTTDYGVEFASSIQKNNVIAAQFHPEKSGDAGMRMLKNYVRMTGQQA
ncbi:imidazole glycerol phosphate synthase subunit HisH [Candidatus Margulisiibacteriota bacterium]